MNRAHHSRTDPICQSASQKRCLRIDRGRRIRYNRTDKAPEGARGPEVIVINDYGSTSLEEKIEELKENPALADVPAIRDGRITSVTLCESFASSMTGDTIEKFARSFHPDCFQ